VKNGLVKDDTDDDLLSKVNKEKVRLLDMNRGQEEQLELLRSCIL
jgi:hypothetical protein